MGTTIAELGAGNRPMDMIVYTKGGADYILMNNSSRGVMNETLHRQDRFLPWDHGKERHHRGSLRNAESIQRCGIVGPLR